MSILLTLDSSQKRPNDSTDDFTITFGTPIEIKPRVLDVSDPNNTNIQWYVALNRIDTWYSWSNISDQYTNRIFTYSPDNGVTWKNITVEQGTYSLQQLNAYIKNVIAFNGDIAANVSITPNFSTGKVAIELVAPYQVRLSTSLMYLLLGFSAAQAAVDITVSTFGDNVGNINNGVSSILIHCSIVDATSSLFSKYGSDIIFALVPQSPPFSNVSVTPAQRLYVAIQSGTSIDKVRVYVTDQLGRRIDLRGEPLTVSLHMEARERLRILDPSQKR